MDAESGRGGERCKKLHKKLVKHVRSKLEKGDI